MAFRLTHWLATVALSWVLIAAWRLPLDSVRPGSRTFSEEEVRHRELEGELRLARTALDQVRRANRLPGEVLAPGEDGVTVSIPEDDAVTAQERMRLRDMVRSEVPQLDPGMRVAYAYDTGTAGESGLSMAQLFRVETYLGVDARGPYCIQVVVTRPGSLSGVVHEDLEGGGWSRWTRSLLGPCTFYAEYGIAGDGIQEWLDAGGVNFAFGSRDEQTLRWPTPPRRSFLGVGLSGRGGLDVERCLTGQPEVCEAVFLRPRDADPTLRGQSALAIRSPVFFAGSARSGPFPAENWFLLDDLEREFGRDAFQRFWTSGEDVRSAFQAAFGVDLGEWLIRWLDNGPGIEPATPAATLASTLQGLLTIALMTGLATAWQWRRQVA